MTEGDHVGTSDPAGRGNADRRPATNPVVLRGFGLGGWMNMENFITGYPGTESQQREPCGASSARRATSRFFDRFLAVFFTDDGCRLPREASA